jgi:hypothetical protein
MVVLPAIKRMPDATKQWLADYAAAGGKVLALDSVAGDGLSARIAAALPADVSITPASPQIGFVHRRLADADVYFLANTSNISRDIRARFSSRTENLELWDPMTGSVERSDVPGENVSLSFEPHGSRVVVFRKNRGGAPPVITRREIGAVALKAGWNVSLGGSERRGVVELPHSWADDPQMRHFSGTAIYSRTVDVPPAFGATGVRVFLDFGAGTAVEREALPGGTMRGNSFAALLAPPVREAATVFVNGVRAGSAWAPPYRVDVTGQLRAGANELRIEVYNTAINQLAEGGRLPDVAAVTERYGQRFRLQDVDNLKPIPSGILTIPKLVAAR